MSHEDIRWQQRFSNYQKALAQLTAFINKGDLNEFEQQGLIKAFEYCFELGWNTVKDFYEAQGETGLQGSRDAIRLAFSRGLIENGEAWLDMVQSRIKTVHTYDEEMANEIATAVIHKYYKLFVTLEAKLRDAANKQSL